MRRCWITVTKAELMRRGQWILARQVIVFLRNYDRSESMPVDCEIDIPWNAAAEIGLVAADLFCEWQDEP